MRNPKAILWFIIILIAATALGYTSYSRANNEWQQDYRDRVSQGIVGLLQNNQYDQYAVVVIVVDGLRWEEGCGAEDTYFPHIWNDLRPLGTLCTNYYIESPTLTTSSHSSMMSGRRYSVPNDGHIRPVFPTFIEYYRDARMSYLQSSIEELISYPPGLLRPDAHSMAEVNTLVSDALTFEPDKTPFYLGKNLLYSLDQSSSGHYPADDVLLIDCMVDLEITEYFRAKIPDVRPNMVVVNLADVDEAAHEGDWHYYVDSIRWADRHVWAMWEALQAETRYRDKTYFFVTTDHGRHTPERGGYMHHDCFCEGCRRSFLLAIGPGIRQDSVTDTPYSELDLAPTIGTVMGFDTPGATGILMSDIFEETHEFPTLRPTETTARIAEDRLNVDERDTGRLLLDTILDRLHSDGTEIDKTTLAMAMLAVAARIQSHPGEGIEWAEISGGIFPTAIDAQSIGDLVLGYPFIQLTREMPPPEGVIYDINMWDGLDSAMNSAILDLSDPEMLDDLDYSEIALISALLAASGNSRDRPDETRFAYTLMLNTLANIEDQDLVYTPDLHDFIKDYNYREDGNEMFTAEISMRDRMWLMWGLERILAEADRSHVEDLQQFLERQYRLMVAFTHDWQDANAMVGGTGDLSEDIDLVAQGISIAALAEFEPWRRWELDELGYSPIIYRTPIFGWPRAHFFYLLGMANALAGGWTANERLRLYVNDDGSIRHDLIDSMPPVGTSSPEYLEAACALAYGFARFEIADYNTFDLETYPLIHQQDISD